MLSTLHHIHPTIEFRVKLSKQGEQARLISVSLDDSLINVTKNCCDVYGLDCNSIQVQFFSTHEDQFLDLYDGTWHLFTELLHQLLQDSSIHRGDVRFSLVLVAREAIGKSRSG
jgi:hypothetical protein